MVVGLGRLHRQGTYLIGKNYHFIELIKSGKNFCGFKRRVKRTEKLDFSHQTDPKTDYIKLKNWKILFWG